MDISCSDKIDLAPLMYQTGYFTIQGHHPISNRYYLGLPNEEVRSAFFNSLLQNFTPIKKVKSCEDFFKALENHQPAFLFDSIGLGFVSFAYQVFVDAKGRTYQGMLLSMLYGMGFEPLSERATNMGCIDAILEVSNTICLMEVKLDSSADAALQQINTKAYFKPYLNKGKHVLILGANFSSKARNISAWKGELLCECGKKVKKIVPLS